MNSLPKDAVRPKAVKASATDIPVFYLNLTLKQDVPYAETDDRVFMDMCELAENVVKRRIEQLPQVAMADMTGVPQRMLRIVPDVDRLEAIGMGIADLENILSANNVEPGSMLVRDGYNEYNIRIASLLRTSEDVENIYFNADGRILQLKDVCSVQIVTQNETGRSLAGGRRAVTLAIIKQSEENMDNLKRELKETTDYFASIYPDIDFSIIRNQTELLDYTISNLQQNFTLGFLFIFIVAVFFIGDVRLPLVIGITMITSVVITFFFFYICRISLNVISLSGLILAVGMMIDNAIIVTENVSQYWEKGYSLKRAAVAGTSEMITPMLSSSLFIEVNEKIDAAMNSLPKDAVRPKAVKASATDIPASAVCAVLSHRHPEAQLVYRQLQEFAEERMAGEVLRCRYRLGIRPQTPYSDWGGTFHSAVRTHVPGDR